MVKLSKNFDINEFTFSPTANAHKINNACGVEHVANLKALCENVLQPLRDYLGVPIIISSGYRCPELNRILKGAVNSQHLKGEAADFIVPVKKLHDVFLYIKDNLPYDQLLFEKNKAGDIWIHVSFRKDGKNRKDAKDNFFI